MLGILEQLGRHPMPKVFVNIMCSQSSATTLGNCILNLCLITVFKQLTTRRSKIGRRALKWLWDGFNGNVISIGQTGSSKSLSLWGRYKAISSNTILYFPIELILQQWMLFFHICYLNYLTTCKAKSVMEESFMLVFHAGMF